jgi:hypothetical protein
MTEPCFPGQAVVVINSEDVTIIGPFPTGDAASDWAFRTLPLGVDWYWLPTSDPATFDLAALR